MSQRVFLPERIGGGLNASCPEVRTETDGGQVSEIGKESGDWTR
jgi:hypothetical protein